MCLEHLSFEELHQSCFVEIRRHTRDLRALPHKDFRLEGRLHILRIAVRLEEVNQPHMVDMSRVIREELVTVEVGVNPCLGGRMVSDLLNLEVDRVVHEVHPCEELGVGFKCFVDIVGLLRL